MSPAGREGWQSLICIDLHPPDDLFAARPHASSLPCHLDQAHDRFERPIGLHDRGEGPVRALVVIRSMARRYTAEIECGRVDGAEQPFARSIAVHASERFDHD
ncbi:MAG: hypothetical protein WB772_20790 [Xanthobacteraceae bacterium]